MKVFDYMQAVDLRVRKTDNGFGSDKEGRYGPVSAVRPARIGEEHAPETFESLLARMMAQN